MRLSFPLWLRQFLAVYLLVAGAVVAMAVLGGRAVRVFNQRQNETLLRTQALLVADGIRAMRADTSPNQLEAMVRRLGVEIGSRITVIDTTGRVLADSRAPADQMSNHRLRPEVKAALTVGAGMASHESRTLGEPMMYFALVSPVAPERRLVVRTSVSLAAMDVLLDRINRTIMITTLVLLLASLVLMAVVNRLFMRPMTELRQAAERIARGDLAVRVPLRRRDEIGSLAGSLNRMSEQLQQLFSRVRAEKEQLQAIIGSMQEGVAVLDEQRRIVLANDSFRRMFDMPAGPAGFVWEALRSTDFQRLVEQAAASGATGSTELLIRNRVYAATAVPVQKELVVVLHDVTEFKELEKVKAEFVANVSHELRTPLTAIKGFVETLQPEVNEEARRYLQIVDRHTDRLINLVNDLLTLSRMESGAYELRRESLDLVAVARDVAGILQRRAQEKALVMEVVDEGASAVRADRSLIEQMLINLLDNAIRYTPAGRITVRVGPEPDLPGMARLEVSDTGIGIPAEHQARIFERFYVVDRNRSRELGGTGLGLAIVKHIVLLHGGAIAVESRPDQGSRFIVRLPAQA